MNRSMDMAACLPIRNRFDNALGASDGITAGEDIGVIALKRQGIHVHGSPITQRAGALVGQATPIRFLPQCRNGVIDFKREFRAGHRFGSRGGRSRRAPSIAF